MATRTMIKNGEVYDIPFEEVEKAASNGFEFTVPMQNAKGETYDIPQSKVENAFKEGLKSEIPFSKSPYELKLEDQATKERHANEPWYDKVSRAVTGGNVKQTFLSGGGNDIRNIATAVGGGVLGQAAPLSQLLANGAVGRGLASGARALANVPTAQSRAAKKAAETAISRGVTTTVPATESAVTRYVSDILSSGEPVGAGIQKVAEPIVRAAAPYAKVAGKWMAEKAVSGVKNAATGAAMAAGAVAYEKDKIDSAIRQWFASTFK